MYQTNERSAVINNNVLTYTLPRREPSTISNYVNGIVVLLFIVFVLRDILRVLRQFVGRTDGRSVALK